MASTIWSGAKTFSANSGVETIVPIPMPHRGILRGYTLIQRDGTKTTLAADLYSSNRESAPNSSLPAETFHVLNLVSAATITADADVVDIVANPNTNIAYLNRDGSPSNPQRYLYLAIKPTGTGVKNFVLSVTIETPTLR
jgi:hypothetical protein